MPIDLQIPNDFFSGSEKEKLKELFEITKEQDFRKAINGVALAGLEEYRDMFLGDGMPMRADDIKQYRLLYLIKHHFENRIPNELEVSIMFQIPESRSRNLLRYVLSRFRHEVEQEILNTIENILFGVYQVQSSDNYQVYSGADNMVEEINRIIALAGEKFKLMSRVPNESHLYVLAPDSLEKIRAHIKKYKHSQPSAVPVR
jgi:hypothetical protein